MTTVTRLHPIIPLFRHDRAVVRLGYTTEAVDVIAVCAGGTVPHIRRDTGETMLCPATAAVRVLTPGPDRRAARPFGAVS